MRWFLLIIVLAVGACGPEPGTSNPYECHDCNLLLISIDTLRADHLGTYGYPVDTSPLIDNLADQSVVFEHAYSTAEKTADSHMSIFTGLHPSSHRILNTSTAAGAFRLGGSIETLTEVLKEANFSTGGFHGGGNVGAHYGFDRGFDTYEGFSRFFERPDTKVDAALQWLEGRDSEKFFLFFHTYFVHDPYLPSPEFVDPGDSSDSGSDMDEVRQLLTDEGFATVRDRFWADIDGNNPEDVARVISLYDATIRETDSFIARLVREVRLREPNTLVVLVSDHGEAFQEHGRFLHTELYNEVIHVPLILNHPAVVEGQRIEQIVSLVDLAPTLLELLGQRSMTTASGQSFAGLLSPDRSLPEDQGSAYSEKLWLPKAEAPVPEAAVRSIIFPDGTKIMLRGKEGVEFYDLVRDPLEADSLAGANRVPPDKMKALVELARQTEALGAEMYHGQDAEKVTLDEEAERQLEALGYLE